MFFATKWGIYCPEASDSPLSMLEVAEYAESLAPAELRVDLKKLAQELDERYQRFIRRQRKAKKK
jgi:hypothetical protein